MNQILFTNNNNNYNKIDTKQIIKFFCIAIIVVAIIIIAIKIYGIYENKKLLANSNIPEIIIIRENDQTKEVTIKASCNDGIQYLVYTWNDEEEKRINLNGSISFERIIEMPENTINNLKIEAVSLKGVKAEKKEIFEKNLENNKPSIDSISIVDKKLKIQVSDDNGLKYLSYRWEDEEEIKVEADENDNKTMSVELDIQRGTYKLWVRVVDIYDNEEILSRFVTGVNEPEISVIKYGDKIKVSVIHDMGFKKIEFIINNKKYVYDERFSKYDKDKTTVEFEFPLKQGENIVQVNAYSQEKLSDEDDENLDNYSFKRFTGKCTYEP
ncbi:MAG: hypothetical protein ACI4U9_05245 [Clostridia bacterium]